MGKPCNELFKTEFPKKRTTLWLEKCLRLPPNRNPFKDLVPMRYLDLLVRCLEEVPKNIKLSQMVVIVHAISLYTMVESVKKSHHQTQDFSSRIKASMFPRWKVLGWHHFFKRIMSISDGTLVMYTLEFEYRYYLERQVSYILRQLYP